MFSLERFLQGVIFISLLGIVLVLFQAGAASTGIVVFSNDYRYPGAEEAVVFDQPQIYRRFYANLESNRPDFYSFQATKGAFLKAKLDTARLVGQDTFRPALALVGPGLPTPSTAERNTLPFTLPPNTGLVLSEPEAGVAQKAATYYTESWTQAEFWDRQNLFTEIPENGPYYLVVFGRGGQSGKYALNVGDKVEASARETLTFPVTWVRTRYWLNDLWWPSFAIGVSGLLLLWLLWLYLRTWVKSLHKMKYVQGNQERARLFPGRIGRWQRRRIMPKTVTPSSKPNLHLAGATKNGLADNTFLKAFGEAETVQINPAWREEENLLIGDRWESLTGIKSLNSNNGHKHEYKNGSSKEVNSNTKNGTEADGLSNWGQRLRPKS